MAAALAVSACGSADDTAGPASTGTPSTATSATTSTPAMTGPSTATSEPAAGASVKGSEIAAPMVAAIKSAKTAHMTIGLAGKELGEGDLDFTPPAKSHVRIDAGGTVIETIQLGSTLYLKGLPGSPKPWTKLDPNGTDAFSKAMGSMTDVARSSDPSNFVKLMSDISGTRVGTEEVGGARTTHYAFTVAKEAYAGLLGEAAQKSLSALQGPVKVGYWVDSRSLPLKVEVQLTVAGQSTSTAIEYSDWGKDVKISAPAAGQVGGPPGS